MLMSSYHDDFVIFCFLFGSLFIGFLLLVYLSWFVISEFRKENKVYEETIKLTEMYNNDNVDETEKKTL